MRRSLLPVMSCATLAFLVMPPAPMALAQSADPQAAAVPPPPGKAATGKTASDKAATGKPPARAAAPRPSPAKAPPAKPAPPPPVPLAPPPAPVLPPPLAVPARPAPEAEPVPIAADAPGTFRKIAGGLSVTFGTGRADFNPDTAAALRTLAHAAQSPDTAFTVAAFAEGDAQDPSSPRRLSLSRALAVRSLLMSEHVASVRIVVKALGATVPPPPGEAADRADVTLGPSPGGPSPGGPSPGGPSPGGPSPGGPATPAAAPPPAPKAAP